MSPGDPTNFFVFLAFSFLPFCLLAFILYVKSLAQFNIQGVKIRSQDHDMFFLIQEKLPGMYNLFLNNVKKDLTRLQALL